MDLRPIGVFDSGLGGLTAVKELMHRLPQESIVYFGDTGRVPYGTRSNETVIKYVFQDIRFLLNFDIKLIIIACGTASSVALEAVRDKFSIPIIGVVEPAVEQAVRVSKNKKIGIIGTTGTVNSGSYARRIGQIDHDIITVSQACPLFVPLVENGYIDNQVVRLVAKEYLAPLKAAKVDTIIMGCTHYPLLRKTIADIMGGDINLIDPGLETARYVSKLLAENTQNKQTAESVAGNIETVRSPELSGHNIPMAQYKYFVSDSIESFSKLGGIFLEKEINQSVEKIDIEKY